MTGVSETIQIAPADLRKLDRAIDKMGDTGLLMRAIGGYVRDATRQRFRDQRAPDGKPWKPSLRAQLTGGATLVDRGLLRDSYIDRTTRDTAEVGTNDIRAAIHHFGGVIRAKGSGSLRFAMAGGGFATVKSVTMPARPALGVNDDDRVEISGLVQDFINMAAAA